MNPYLITEATCISFSGGRTSAYMLYRILEANGGLPDEAVVCFANTGKEEEATLEFVRDCSVNWNVPITWIEYRSDEVGYAITDFESASRGGEPFEQMIHKIAYLPNPVTRVCTFNLKVKIIDKYLKDKLGKDTYYDSMIGIRYDEQRRAAKIRANPNPNPNTARSTAIMPLVDDEVTKEIVGIFWQVQDFDLGLPNMNGVTMHGNCDLCFLKGGYQVQSLIQEKPERAIWWAKMEALALASKPDGAKFRKDRPSYQQMYDNAMNQKTLDFNDESISCFCGD